MRLLLATCAALALAGAGSLYGQEAEAPKPVDPSPAPFAQEDLVEIQGPTTATPGGYFIVSALAPAPADNVRSEVTVKIPDGAAPPIELLGKKPGEAVYLYQQVVPGAYVFKAAAQVSVDKADGFDPHDLDELTVTVAEPIPPGPTPPGPTPPTPPGPTPPTPDTVGPIFGVVLYDTEGDDGITPAQRLSLNSAEVHAYLQAKGLKLGGHVQWRVWDDDSLTDDALAEESEVLRKAYAEAKAKAGGKAWLVVSNGKSGFSGPLPETHEAILALLKRFGG